MKKYLAAFKKVFGQANLEATSRSADPKTGERQVMRIGKTKRDKAKGHKATDVNRRLWDDKACKWIRV